MSRLDELKPLIGLKVMHVLELVNNPDKLMLQFDNGMCLIVPLPSSDRLVKENK